MIIFYNKKTGNIVGSIDGRKHSEDQLKMWVGDKKENGRIVCSWERTGEERTYEREEERLVETPLVDADGLPMFKKLVVITKETKRDYEPDHEQKDIFNSLDRKETKLSDYYVDVIEKRLKKR